MLFSIFGSEMNTCQLRPREIFSSYIRFVQLHPNRCFFHNVFAIWIQEFFGFVPIMWSYEEESDLPFPRFNGFSSVLEQCVNSNTSSATYKQKNVQMFSIERKTYFINGQIYHTFLKSHLLLSNCCVFSHWVGRWPCDLLWSMGCDQRIQKTYLLRCFC